MSQKTNIENLNSILDTVNSLPDAGSGGGGTPETCTVNITCTNTTAARISYTRLNSDANLETVYNHYSTGEISVLTLENVICNTLIFISIWDPYEIPGASIEGSAEFLSQ